MQFTLISIFFSAKLISPRRDAQRCILTISFFPLRLSPLPNDYNPHACSCFNCVRKSRRMYVYINKFPSPPLHVLSVIFTDFPVALTESALDRTPNPPSLLRRAWIENVCAFISSGLRAPIECKIMATCRIFAGATVTNISDKVPPASLPPSTSVQRPAHRSVPSRRRVSYLSILIYRELILRRYHIFDPSASA